MTTAGSGHVVLAEADSAAFGSLRRRPTSRTERYAMGRALRQKVPRSTLGGWQVRADRPDPVELIRESHRGRLDWLIPTRVARMAGSPYGFLRGSAIVMASDVAALPATGITPVICGDAHLGNFGFYASPSATSSSTSTTSTRPIPEPGSGTCAGWSPASTWPVGRTAPPRRSAGTPSVAACARTGST